MDVEYGWDRKAVPYLQSNFMKAHSRFSPDGRWVTYASDESGTSEIYVESFPAGHGKWKVSDHGGDQPYWSWDGKEIFYMGLDRQLMTIRMKIGTGIEAGQTKSLFQTHMAYPTVADERNNFIVSHDGQRVLVNEINERGGSRPISVLVNWRAFLKH